MTLLLVAIGLSLALARNSWSSGAVLLFVLLLAVPGLMVDALILFGRGWRAGRLIRPTGRAMVSGVPFEEARVTAGRRQTKKAVATRSRILDAAAEVYRTKGYAGMRLGEVAERAHTQAGSLYYYFGSREELVEGVLRLGIERTSDFVRGRVAALPPGTTSQERLRVAIAAHVEVVLKIGNYTAAPLRIVSQVPEAVRGRRIEGLREYGRFWRDLVNAALADGQVRDDLDRSAVRMLMLGGMNAAPAWFRAEDAALSAQDLTAQFVTVFLEGMARVRGAKLRDVTVELAAVTTARSAMAIAEGEDGPVTRRILDAAATVFAEQGYSGARLADIAEAAGVKEPTFYHHFATREELVVAFLDSAWGRTSALISATLDALPAGSTALTRFVTAMVAHLVSMLHDDFYPAAWVTIVGQLPEDVRARTAGAQRSLVSVGRRLYEAAVAAGEIRDDLDTSSVLMTLVGTLNWVADWYQRGAGLIPEDLAAHFTTLVLDGFAA